MWMAECVSYMEEMSPPVCTMGRKQAGGGTLMLWAMFYLENMGHAIHGNVNLTPTTYLYFVSVQVHLLMSSGILSRIIHPDICKKWFRKFEEHNNEFAVLI